MSTSATPSSFSSSVSTDSLAASCSTTVSATVDAGAVHARDDVLRRALAAGDDVDVDLEARAGHADRRADAVLLVDDEVLRQHVEDLAAGRQRHRLGGVDRAPHVLARDLAVLAGDGDHAAAVEALDVRARQREVHRVDLDAGHQLGLLDRLLDRVDRRLEVDDDAAPDAARLGDAEPDDVEAVAVEHLADDGRHLRRADVEPDQISLFTRHSASGRVPIAASRPASPLPSPAAAASTVARRAGRPHVNAIVEPQVHVVDVGDALAQRRRQLEIRLQPRQELVLAELDAPPDRRSRITDALCRSRDVDLRQPPRDLRLRARAPRSRARPARRARRRSSRRPSPATRDRPSMIGRSRSAYCGPYSIDDHAALVDQIHVAVDAGRCRSAAAPTRRPRPSTAATAAAPRRAPTATPAAAAASASRSVHSRFSPRRPLEHARALRPSTAARCRARRCDRPAARARAPTTLPPR